MFKNNQLLYCMSYKSKIIDLNKLDITNNNNYDLKTSYIQKIKNFISRLLVYHVIIIWLYMRIFDIDKSLDDFKKRINKSTTHFNLKGSFVDYLSDEPIMLYLVLIISETISLITALFGSKIGAFILSLHFLFTNLLFFNPFLPENSFDIFKLDIRSDMLSSFGVVSCFFLIAFYPDEYKESSENIHVISDIEDDI